MPCVDRSGDKQDDILSQGYAKKMRENGFLAYKQQARYLSIQINGEFGKFLSLLNVVWTKKQGQE